MAGPILRAEGWEIEVWAARVTSPAEVDKWVRIVCPPLPAPFNYWIFSMLATAYRLFVYPLRPQAEKNRTVLFSTGYYSWIVHYSLIHFSSWDWFKAQLKLKIESTRELIQFLGSMMSSLVDWLMANNPYSGILLPVSRSIAEDFKGMSILGRDFRVLPNARNVNQFTCSDRLAWRERSRNKFEFHEEDIVFAMTAMGHFKRKGLFNAIEALDRLRKSSGRSEIRFILIGGNEKALKLLIAWLDRYYVEWRTWIKLTGIVENVGECLSAADAFIFPSYSEAFSLAEVEASAMGLRLYLTPHHGSEMILNPDKNGRFIDWDPARICEVLWEDLHSGKIRCHDGAIGESLSLQTYAQKISAFAAESILRRSL